MSTHIEGDIYLFMNGRYAKKNPNGKDNKELQVVNRIVRVSPPQCLLIIGDKPKPP